MSSITIERFEDPEGPKMTKLQMSSKLGIPLNFLRIDGPTMNKSQGIPGYLTGTPMETLVMTAVPGVYPFPTIDSISRRYQVSDDGIAWTNVGNSFSNNQPVPTGIAGKLIRMAETAISGIQSITTFTPAYGPVSAFSALPSVPLAAGEKLWALGDSQVGYNNYYGGPIGSTSSTIAGLSTSYGFIEKTKALDPRFSFETWYDTTDPYGRNFVGANFGIFGDHVTYASTLAPGIVNRIPDLLAKNPKIAVFQGGYNTVNSDDVFGKGTSEFVIRNLDAGLSKLRMANCIAILLVPYPSTAWPANDPRYTTLEQVRAWCRTQSTRDGVYVLDPTDILAPSGIVDTTMLRTDGVHLSSKGASAVAKNKFLPLIQTLFSAGTFFNTDVTVNNLLTSTQVNMDGTAGTMSNGTGSMPNTGVVPTGYAVARGRNCSIVNSIDDYVTGKHRMNMAVTPYTSDSGADMNNYFEISVTIPTYTLPVTGEPNKWYQSFFYIEVDEAKDLTFVESLIGFYVGTSTVGSRPTGLSRESSGDFALGNISGPLAFWLPTPPFKNHGNNVSINGMRGFLRFTGNRKGTPLNIKISRPIYREVPDPKIAWGF